jgi:hypothetical protein
MQNPAKSKGLFLAIGIFAGMILAFTLVWLNSERIPKRLMGQVQKVFSSDNTIKHDTVTVVVEKEVPVYNNNPTLDTTALATDSLATDSTDFLVKKDELLYTKTFKLIELKNGSSAIDSAMAKAADVDPTGLPQNFSVEFWKSPINYKGYKMGRGKIVLFGIYQSNDVSLVSIGNNVFLKNQDLYFRLEPTEAFCNLNPVTDKNLLAQLSK